MDEYIGGTLRSFFCRVGSKRPIADKIIKLFPDDITTYVEPFIGSGAILWKKDPHPKEVINDLDSELIRDYRLLKSIKARNFREDMDTVPELQRFVDKPARTDADRLTRAIVTRCNTFGSMAKGAIYKSANPYKKLQKIDEYQERLKDVTILNQSYEKVVKKYDSPTTLFYCDPPYEMKTKEAKVYTHDADEFDQQKLRDTLAACKGYWIVSINDSPNIRSIYKGFYYIAFTHRSSGTKSSIGQEPRKELIIANYPISRKMFKKS